MAQLRRVAVVSAVLTLAIFSVIIFALGGSASLIVASLLKGGAALTVTGLFWTAYDRYLWRKGPIFRVLGWLSPLPDLNGRWEGTVKRHEEVDDGPGRPFVIEIQQTFTSIGFRTFSRNSRGVSEHAWLTGTQEGSIFQAGAVWRTTTKRRDDGTAEETFYGTSLWRIDFEDEPGDYDDKLGIVDNYYTARVPATAGIVKVRRVSRKLRNSFDG